MNNLITSLFKPIDISSIVFFRIVFGLLIFLKIGTYIFSGYVELVWLEPDFNFTYYGFHWVGLIPKQLIYPIVLLVWASALFIAIGFLYRISTVVFFLGFSCLFLLEQAMYLNHYYMVILVAFLMIFIPAHTSFSVDSMIWPSIKRKWIYSWCLWILMFQMGVVYIYGGIAKINLDWLQAWPLRIWLEEENFGNESNRLFFAYLFSYLGLLFDLFIVPLLLYRRTRIFGFILAIIFHSLNKYIFNIGIFPAVSLALTALFFPPDWPRRLLTKSTYTPDLSSFRQIKYEDLNLSRKFLLLVLAIFVSFQILFPFRHILYPGNVAWTEEGHKFSWRMKLRDKSGHIKFYIRNPVTDQTWKLDPEIYLNNRQEKKLATRPNLVIQFAHFIEDQFKQIGYENVEVRARAKVSLNGRKKQLIIDPNVDLTMYDESMMPAEWILPLTKPLRKTKK